MINAMFLRAPDNLPSQMPALLVELARLWAEDPDRPKPQTHVLKHWDTLIAEWVDDETLPLYIRKAANNRGSLLTHRTGRLLIPSDNSPAQWSYTSAMLGQLPSLDDIRDWMAADRIPVAMMLKPNEVTAAKYRCRLGNALNPNSLGWKVCHIEGVGLKTRIPVVNIELSVLREHFRRFMGPSNMFVIPLKYAGLGEIPEFCHAIGQRR